MSKFIEKENGRPESKAVAIKVAGEIFEAVLDTIASVWDFQETICHHVNY